jgi:hypothetical protein
LRVQFCAERLRRTLQLTTTPIDYVTQRENHIGGNFGTRTFDDGQQNGQIVIVAKQVRDFAGSVSL